MADADRRLQLAAAIASAAVMAVGIAVFDWPAITVLALYWLENVIIGVFTVLRVLVAGALTRRYVAALFTAAFFGAHYGAFCFGHGLVVATLFGGDAAGGDPRDEILLMVGRAVGDRTGLLVVAAMVAAAAVDSWRILKSITPDDVEPVDKALGSPYDRIIVLHVVLIGGGMLMLLLKLPAAAALLLVAIKLAYDLRQWRRSAPVPAAT